jgi:hypothetical protein
LKPFNFVNSFQKLKNSGLIISVSSDVKFIANVIGIMVIQRFHFCPENHGGRLGRGDIGETGKRLTDPHLFLRISGGLSGNFEYPGRIKYALNVSNRILEKKSRLRWEGAGILIGDEKKGRFQF